LKELSKQSINTSKPYILMDKKPLNPQIAEEFARKIFDSFSIEEEKEFNKIHAKTTIECAVTLAEGKKIAVEILELAGWLHDIGKIMNSDNHPQYSLELLEKEEFEIDEKLKDCILNHGTAGNPQSEEAKIMQIADKVSMINPEFLELIKTFLKTASEEERENYLEVLRKNLNNAVDLLKKY